ncbi:MAG: dihydroorotase [Bacteroidia bacterium]
MEKQTTDSKSGTILIRKVSIADPGSVHNNRTADIFISNGVITQIGDITQKADTTIDGKNCIATPGLFDLRSRHGEPGLEQNEDLESIINAASAGGFTGIATLPDTHPTIQSRAQIEYLLRKAHKKIVSVYPLGATTLETGGKELAELYDMHQGGAIGFSNGDSPYNSGALQRALLYTKNFDGLIFSHAEDKNLSNGGFVNESSNTASLGLKHFAAHAEYTEVAREIEIARYTESRLHFSHISTAQSVDLIKKAKAEGLKMSCDVSILHLILTDKTLETFDANLKLMPPLRSEKDRKALIKGINDGTIDCIVSDHNPQSPEHKVVEFNYSPFGAITIQILFSLYNQFLSKDISLENFVKATSQNPRKILNLSIASIEENSPANLAIFDTDKEWEFNTKTNKSLSSNSHLMGTKLKGQCVFIINNKLSINCKS